MHLKDLFSKQCCLGTIGICLTGFGAIFAFFWIELFESMLAKEMKLGPNTKSYEIWKTPPLPMSMDIYFFNWTNPTNFTKEHFIKPILQELGPYRFTENMDKVDVNWHAQNSTVSFRKKSTFFFDDAGSKGNLNDTITTLNIIALAAATKASTWNFINRKSVSVGLSLFNQEGHVTKTARELLFEGYQDDMIDTAREMPFLNDQELSVPFDRFGWFYMRNGTSNLTGHYNMHTGDGDISRIGKVERWDYRNRTDYFPGLCGLVNGSAGEFYSPKQRRDQPISFFSADMCRSIAFDYAEDQIVNGIVGYKYSGNKRTVDNGTVHEENACYSFGQGVPSGVMNVTACRFGTPVFMSFPHFYAADSYYLDQVIGMSPNQSKHEFYMTLEPMTGIPLDVAARLQINMLIRPVDGIGLYQNAPYMFFPVLWFEQKVTINEAMAAEVRTVVNIPMAGYVCCGIVTAVGVVLVLWLLLVRLVSQKQRCELPKVPEIGTTNKVCAEGSPLIRNGYAKTMENSNFSTQKMTDAENTRTAITA